MLWLMWMACGWNDESGETEVREEVVRAAEQVMKNPSVGTGAVSSARTLAIDSEAPLEPVVTRSGIGFLEHDTSRKKLARKLGEDQVVDHQFDQGEGIFLPGVKIMPGTPFELNLQTDGDTIERIEVVGDAYALESGIHVGSTLAELRRALGDFEVFGYGWDHGGTLRDADFEPPGFQVAIRTEPTEGREVGARGREVLQGGDRAFPSTHEGLDELAPTVAAITLVWRDAR